jgi:hypothetical protein
MYVKGKTSVFIKGSIVNVKKIYLSLLQAADRQMYAAVFMIYVWGDIEK